MEFLKGRLRARAEFPKGCAGAGSRRDWTALIGGGGERPVRDRRRGKFRIRGLGPRRKLGPITRSSSLEKAEKSFGVLKPAGKKEKRRIARRLPHRIVRTTILKRGGGGSVTPALDAQYVRDCEASLGNEPLLSNVVYEFID